MPPFSRRSVIAQGTALLVALAVVIPAEVEHWQSSRGANASWFVGINVDTTLPFLLLLVLPYFWFVRRPFWTLHGIRWMQFKMWWCDGPATRATAVSAVPIAAVTTSVRTADTAVARGGGLGGTWFAAALIAATSLGVSVSVFAQRVGDRESQRFGDLPPAFHDEYSYLLQADTYLTGRLSFESHPTAARLFDQMHVLNEGRFASRYFPATGLFVAPWRWLGRPVLGHWLAGAATCVLVFGLGRELSNNGVGFLAGMLTALSPGMGLFGNLVLAHHPTLLGLFFFAWSFVRWLRTDSLRDVAFAGIGLSWAMLCRPMTAAGFGLPFGIVYGWRIYSGLMRSLNLASSEFQTRQRPVLRTTTAMSLPFVVAFGFLFVHNKAITGSVSTSPYQLFTDIYTPRHVYGFNNVVRGEQHLGPRVLDNYDRWAVNLTPALAVENSKNRLIASWQWTVGIIPLLAATVVFVVIGPDRDRRWWLVFAAIASLFVAHVPYWFDGMFHWHYVFETGPLWCLLLAAATDSLCRCWLQAERPRMPLWWAALVSSAVLVNLVDVPPFWFPSKLQAVVEQVAFSRLKYQAFEDRLRRDVTEPRALILIETDPADRHIDYVVNEPSLTASVLRARWPVPDWTLERVQAVFPDRTIYLFRAKTGELNRIAGY